MWYLVIPPIIVVLSLSFLLWYLSRKGSDPVIAETLSQSEEAKPSFSRTKEFFLRILEKWAQRFKVASLRTHNSLHEFTQSVKESRRKIHGSLLSRSEESPLQSSVEREGVEAPVSLEEKKEGFLSRFKSSLAPQENVSLTSEVLSEPIVRRKREEKEEEKVKVTTSVPESVPRPMVSETATEPEIHKKRTKPNVSREESLIARIAVNPKDFTAYEELGDYYLEIENIKDAKECYRQVLKLSPVHRMVKIKIRRLEKLLTREGE